MSLHLINEYIARQTARNVNLVGSRVIGLYPAAENAPPGIISAPDHKTTDTPFNLTRQRDENAQEIQRLEPPNCGPSAAFDNLSIQLLHHFDQRIATKLAWVDGPENPWRQIILPLSHASPIVLYSVLAMASEDLAHKYTIDRPSFHRLQGRSLYYRDKARFALASVLLYNVELLAAEAAQWRVHIQRPPELADSFLLYEYYFTAVFNGLTTFDVMDCIMENIPTNDGITVFADFFRITHSVTRAERLKVTRGSTFATARIEDVSGELEAARGRTIEHNQTIRFQDPDARCDFEHLTYMYSHASLIYSHRVLSDYAPSENLIRGSLSRCHPGSPPSPHGRAYFA
ncbi:hypothetical protein BBP40_011984 [Aspergillus hancockii]|nr:hypothetical protein BBP40_011984 [Aspergillus hancockii]